MHALGQAELHARLTLQLLDRRSEVRTADRDQAMSLAGSEALARTRRKGRPLLGSHRRRLTHPREQRRRVGRGERDQLDRSIPRRSRTLAVALLEHEMEVASAEAKRADG